MDTEVNAVVEVNNVRLLLNGMEDTKFIEDEETLREILSNRLADDICYMEEDVEAGSNEVLTPDSDVNYTSGPQALDVLNKLLEEVDNGKPLIACLISYEEVEVM